MPTSWISKNSTSNWLKWFCRSRSMTLISNTTWEYPRMYVWYKFGDASSNLWQIILQTRKSLQTDGLTQATNNPLQSDGPSGNKNDIKCQNTLGCLVQIMRKRLRLWNNWDLEAVWICKYMQRMETVKQLGPWSSLGSHGYYVFTLVVWAFSLVVKPGMMKFWFLS